MATGGERRHETSTHRHTARLPVGPDDMDRTAERLHVLYVGAERGFVEYLHGTDEPVEVSAAGDASEAAGALEAGDVDCVVSEYDLPGTDGIALLEGAREDHPDLPFVLLAGAGGEAVASDALDAGASDCLTKESGPGQHAVVARRVRNAVEKHRTERELDALRRRYELVTDASADAFWDWDVETDEVVRGDGYTTQFGYDESEVGADVDWWMEAVHPDDRERVGAAIDRALADPDAGYDEVYRLRMGDGTYGYVHSRGSVVYDEDGEPVRMVGAHTDVTGRMRREDALGALHRATREFQDAPDKQAIADHAVETARTVLGLDLNAVWLYDDGDDALRPVASTDGVVELFGEVPTFAGPGSLAWEAFESGEVLVYEDLKEQAGLYNPDTPIASEMILPVGEHGLMIVGSTEREAFDDIDVSLSHLLVETAGAAMRRAEREREMREQRRELERQNERLDEFASVLSHDLRGPLNVARGRLEMAMSECDSDHLDAATSALDRMNQITERTLTLARSGRVVGETEPVALAELARRCWGTVRTADADVTVDDPPAIRADPTRLRHLFENLFRNAVEHGGEDVSVRVGTIGEDGFYVEDDGPGIPPDARDDVFEPGYTTGADGTGLGLNIVHDIAKAHGWDVELCDRDGGGARFEVTGVDVVEP